MADRCPLTDLSALPGAIGAAKRVSARTCTKAELEVTTQTDYWAHQTDQKDEHWQPRIHVGDATERAAALQYRTLWLAASG